MLSSATSVTAPTTNINMSNGNANPTITPTDFNITCSDGILLAAQIWKIPSSLDTVNDTTTTKAQHTRKVLCVHGWMDNCRSFHYFAPELLQQIQMNSVHKSTTNTSTTDTNTNTTAATINDIVDIEIVAIDLPGHGWSSHKSLDGPPIHITDYVYYIAETIQQLQWSASTTTIDDRSTSTTGTTKTVTHPNPKIILVGHSMGAAICSMYAATFIEQIHQLILLEGGTFTIYIIQNVDRYIYASF
jgi:pimeloyl-ACP methyl ester carboxylesterase